MEKLSLIEHFRKLEKELGKAPSDTLLHILDNREEMLFNKLSTKEDLKGLKANFNELKADLRADIQKIESQMSGMRSDMEDRFATREDLQVAISAIRSDVANLAWKMSGLFTLQIAVVVAIMKLI